MSALAAKPHLKSYGAFEAGLEGERGLAAMRSVPASPGLLHASA